MHLSLCAVFHVKCFPKVCMELNANIVLLSESQNRERNEGNGKGYCLVRAEN